jgi:regulator of replication initiation timing
MQSWIIIGVLIALISSAGGAYYYSTQKKLAQLIENNATLEANNITITNANQQNVQTIDDLQTSYQQVQENFSRVQSEFQIIRLQNNELKERLGRHELDALAAAKPGLVERTVNNASANATRCFELMSGAPLNEKEMAATTERQFNSECPWLFLELRQ